MKKHRLATVFAAVLAMPGVMVMGQTGSAGSGAGSGAMQQGGAGQGSHGAMNSGTNDINIGTNTMNNGTNGTVGSGTNSTMDPMEVWVAALEQVTAVPAQDRARRLLSKGYRNESQLINLQVVSLR